MECCSSLDIIWITLSTFVPITPLKKCHILVTKVPLHPKPMMRSLAICVRDSKQWLYIRHTPHIWSKVAFSIFSWGSTRFEMVNLDLPMEWDTKNYVKEMGARDWNWFLYKHFCSMYMYLCCFEGTYNIYSVSICPIPKGGRGSTPAQIGHITHFECDGEKKMPGFRREG